MFPSLSFVFAGELQQLVACVLVGLFISSALKIVLAPVFGEGGARLISSLALFGMAAFLGGRVVHEVTAWQAALTAQILGEAVGPVKAAIEQMVSNINTSS